METAAELLALFLEGESRAFSLKMTGALLVYLGRSMDDDVFEGSLDVVRLAAVEARAVLRARFEEAMRHQAALPTTTATLPD